MGHDSHAVLSPAHRRNQNPASPSASVFRRSSTSFREEPDLSWVALFRRHRFLLLMLALLAFLCTVYLYFAIRLGGDSCSDLAGKDEALCRLEKMNAKTLHGHRRMLLNVGEPWIQEPLQVLNNTDFASWMKILSKDPNIQRVMVLECKGKSFFTQDLNPRFLISLPGIGCEERRLFKEKHEERLLTILQRGYHLDSVFYDLIICDKCNMRKFLNDESKFEKLDRLLREGGYLMWILDTTDKFTSTSSLEDVQLHGWSRLSRLNEMVLWQKL